MLPLPILRVRNNTMNPVVENGIKSEIDISKIMKENIFININKQSDLLFWSNAISH